MVNFAVIILHQRLDHRAYIFRFTAEKSLSLCWNLPSQLCGSNNSFFQWDLGSNWKGKRRRCV